MSEQHQHDPAAPADTSPAVDLYGNPAFKLLFGEGLSGWQHDILKLPDREQPIYKRLIKREQFGHANPLRLHEAMSRMMRHFVGDDYHIRFQQLTGEIFVIFDGEAFDRTIAPYLSPVNRGSLACPSISATETMGIDAHEGEMPDSEASIKARNEQILRAALAHEGPSGWHYDHFNDIYYRDVPKAALRHIIPVNEENVANSKYVTETPDAHALFRVTMPRKTFEDEYLPWIEGASDSELGLNIVPVNFRDPAIGNEPLPNLRHRPTVTEEAVAPTAAPEPAPAVPAPPPAHAKPTATMHLDMALNTVFGQGREGFHYVSVKRGDSIDHYYERTVTIAQPGIDGDVLMRNVQGILNATCGKQARVASSLNEDNHYISLRIRIPSSLFIEKFHPSMADHSMGTLRHTLAPDLAKGFQQRFERGNWQKTMFEVELFGGGMGKWHPWHEQPYRDIPKLRRSGNIKEEFALIRNILDEAGLYGAEIRQSEDKPRTLRIRLLGDVHREALQEFYNQRPELSGVVSIYR